MDQKLNVGRAGRRKYLCSGIVTCAACHGRMYGHSQKKGDKLYCSYICENHCGGMRSIPADELERAACAYVNALLAPQVREQLTVALAEYMDNQRDAARRRAPQARRDIAKLQGQIDAITENIASGVLPPSVLKRLGDQVTDLEAQIDVLQNMAAEPPQVDLGSITAYFAEAAEISADDDFAEVQRTLRRFIASITVHSTHIEFICTFDAWLRKYCPELIPASIALIPPDAANHDDDDPDDTPPSGGSPRSHAHCASCTSSSSSRPFYKEPTPASRNSLRTKGLPSSAMVWCRAAAAA